MSAKNFVIRIISAVAILPGIFTWCAVLEVRRDAATGNITEACNEQSLRYRFEDMSGVKYSQAWRDMAGFPEWLSERKLIAIPENIAEICKTYVGEREMGNMEKALNMINGQR